MVHAGGARGDGGGDGGGGEDGGGGKGGGDGLVVSSKTKSSIFMCEAGSVLLLNACITTVGLSTLSKMTLCDDSSSF